MRIRALRFVFFLLLSSLIGAHLVMLAPHASAEPLNKPRDESVPLYDLPRNGYFQVLYNASNGLTSSEANDIVQSPDGFVWIGSYTGLTQYDGTTFRRFTAENGVCSIQQVFIDSKQRVWLNTLDKGVARLEQDKLVFLGQADGLSSNTTQSLCELPNGNIAVATARGIDLILQEGGIQSLQVPKLAEKNIVRVASTGDGGMAGVTMDGDVFIVRPDFSLRYIPKEELYDTPITTLNVEKEPGTFLLSTAKSIVVQLTVHQDGTLTHSAASVEPLAGINQLQRLPNGELWLCADNGIGFFSADNVFHLVSGSLLTSSVNGMLLDYEQNLWFTSSRQGILKITPNRFFSINDAARLPSAVANTTTIWRDLLYIGTDNGLYAVDSANTPASTPLTKLLENMRIRHVGPYEDELVLSTFSPYGLLFYNADGSSLSLTEQDGLPSGMVRVTLPLRNGNLAVGTRKGLAIVRDKQVIQIFDKIDGLRNSQVLCLFEDEDGTLYVGTDGEGLFILKNGELIARYTQDHGLDSAIILRVKVDPEKGGLWVLTGNTIAYIAKNKAPQIIRKFPFINNTDVLFPGNGSMWVFSNGGISITTSTEMLDSGPLRSLFYGTSDGLPGTMVANTFSHMTPEGLLYLCTSYGVAQISTKNHSMRTQAVRLAVPKVMVDDQPFYIENGKVTIPADSQRLTIEAHTMTNRLSNPLLSAQLIGFENTPVVRRKSDMPILTYTNLRGGHYDFQYTLLADISHEPEHSLNVRIYKELALTEEPLFFLGIGIIVLLLLFAVFRLYVYSRTQALLRQSMETRQLLTQVIQAFAKAIEFKDSQTKGHSSRVAKYAAAIAREMGMPDERITRIHDMGMLHDVGKILIPDHILTKPSSLTEEEYAIIRKHAEAGSEILTEISSFPEIALGAKYHHEHIDGTGYPYGLKGEAIPLEARIIAVADVFDAMAASRHYRKGMHMTYVRDELTRASGKHLDADIVEVMLRLIDRWAGKNTE